MTVPSKGSGVTVKVGVPISWVGFAGSGVDVCVGAGVAGAAQAVRNRITIKLRERRKVFME
jgi:hypothetical protein